MQVESSLVDLGRWIPTNVFEGDAAAALEQRRTNPVWHELTRRAGGPTLRLSERLLHVSLSIAAHDKRITHEAWRKLEPGRKELLLPLGDERSMRDAAQRVVDMKLTQRETRNLVRDLRQKRGDQPAVRVTAQALIAGVRRLGERLSDLESANAIAPLVERLDHEQRAELSRSVDALETRLRAVVQAIKRSADHSS